MSEGGFDRPVDYWKLGEAFKRYRSQEPDTEQGYTYILSSLLWLWGVENTQPDRWDVTGAAVCFLGAAIILFGPRGA